MEKENEVFRRWNTVTWVTQGRRIYTRSREMKTVKIDGRRGWERKIERRMKGLEDDGTFFTWL